MSFQRYRLLKVFNWISKPLTHYGRLFYWAKFNEPYWVKSDCESCIFRSSDWTRVVVEFDGLRSNQLLVNRLIVGKNCRFLLNMCEMVWPTFFWIVRIETLNESKINEHNFFKGEYLRRPSKELRTRPFHLSSAITLRPKFVRITRRKLHPRRYWNHARMLWHSNSRSNANRLSWCWKIFCPQKADSPLPSSDILKRKQTFPRSQWPRRSRWIQSSVLGFQVLEATIINDESFAAYQSLLW